MSENEASKVIVDAKQARAIFSDTLRNLVSNLGTTRDKNSYGTFVEGNDLSRNRHLADTIYRFQWMSKIVDIPAYDMVREWRTFKSETLSPEKFKKISQAEKRVDYKAKIQDALTWAFLYGGCAIIISVDGHGDASIPLDVTKIRPGQLKAFHVVDRHRLFPQTQEFITDPLSPNFGNPEFYTLANSSQLVHSSRIVKFIGKRAPFWPRHRLLWWGDSVLTRLYDCFRHTETVISSIASLVQETNIDVIKNNSLADALASDGTEAVAERYALMAMMKAINNMMLLDGEETYERKPADFKSLPQLMQQFLAVLSAASDIPATRFLGKSPEGLNATGESDLTNYYDRISGQQESDLGPQMRYLDEVMIRSEFGNFPEGLEWKFNPLWQMSEKDQADINLVRSNTLLNLQTLGVPDEALLNDVMESDLSNNLTEKLIKEALAEIEEDEETEQLLSGENNDPDKPDSDKADPATEPPEGDMDK